MDDTTTREIFSWQQTTEVLRRVCHQHNFVIATKSKSFIARNEASNTTSEFFPPLVQSIGEASSVEQYLQMTSREIGSQLVLLVQAGAAALAIWNEGELGEHKVIKKYMVRKKSGKAQLTYLNKKGKSRAGSRLRLRNSMAFFDEINEKLWEWEESLQQCRQLFYSCPVRLWSELFNAKSKGPIVRDDPRWLKVPLDVRVPCFKEVCHIFYELSHGRLVCYQDGGGQ